MRLKNNGRTPPKGFNVIPGVTLDINGKPLPEQAIENPQKKLKTKEKKHKKSPADKNLDNDSPFPVDFEEEGLQEKKEPKTKKKTPKSPEL